MPMYPMVCDDCGYEEDLVAHMNDEKSHKCSCGAQMRRNWQNSNVHTSADSYSRDIHSDSLAISPDQVAEHKQHFPKIEIDNQCRPVFSNYRDHNVYLEKTGFTKQRQKIRRSTRKATP